MTATPTAANLSERLATLDRDDFPTSPLGKADLHRARMALSSMPYLGGHFTPLPDAATVADLTDRLGVLAAVLDTHAQECRHRETELFNITNDIAAARRIFGMGQAR